MLQKAEKTENRVVGVAEVVVEVPVEWAEVEAEEAAVEDTTTDDMTMAVTQVTVEREQLKYSFNIT
jgi:hypothetical protein